MDAKKIIRMEAAAAVMVAAVTPHPEPPEGVIWFSSQPTPHTRHIDPVEPSAPLLSPVVTMVTTSTPGVGTSGTIAATFRTTGGV